MAAKLFFLPSAPVISPSSLLVSGAQLYFYASGTNTPRTVYSDAALTIALPTPVVANAGGYFPDIYIDDTLIYRARCIDPSSGETLFDVDPYYPGVAMELSGEILEAASDALGAAAQAEAARDLAIATTTDYATLALATANAANGSFFSYTDASGYPVYATKTAGVVTPLPGPWIGADKIGNVSKTGLTMTGTLDEVARNVVYLPSVSGFTFDTSNPTTAGAANSAALIAAWDYLKTIGGGKVLLPQKGFYLAPTQLAMANNSPMGIEGIGGGAFRSSQIWPSTSGSGTPTDWVLDFADNSATVVGHLTLRFFSIRPRTDPASLAARPVINGMRVGQTNQLTVDKCFVYFLAGHGAWFSRPHNSDIIVKTFRCGVASLNLWGQTYMGSFPVSDAQSTVGNEIAIGGTTEEDELGIRIHHCVNVRTFMGKVKLHGSEHTQRLLEIYRVGNFDLNFDGDLGFAGPEAIYIGDNSGVEQPTEAGPVKFPISYTSGRIKLDAFPNFESYSASKGALFKHDVGSGLIEYTGNIYTLPGTYGTDWEIINFTATTTGIGLADIQGIVNQAGPVSTGITDGRTVNKRFNAFRGSDTSALILPRRAVFPGNTAQQSMLGEFSGYGLPAVTNVSPERRFTGLKHSTGTGGTSLNEGGFAFGFDTATASASMVLGHRAIPAITGGRSRIVVATLTAEGVAAYSAGAHWLLRIYREGAVFTNLVISSDTLYTTGATYHPDRRDSVTFTSSASGAVATSLQFWTGVVGNPGLFTGDANQFLRVELVKIGAPANLTNVHVGVHLVNEA